MLNSTGAERPPKSSIARAVPEVNRRIMRKRLIRPIPQDAPTRDDSWLDLNSAAVVEVTSEEKEYPVEVCAGLRRNVGLACRRFWHSIHSTNLR
jgi:hypothetical protein